MKKSVLLLLLCSVLGTVTVFPVHAGTDFNKTRTEVIQKSQNGESKSIDFVWGDPISHPQVFNQPWKLAEFHTHSYNVELKSNNTPHAPYPSVRDYFLVAHTGADEDPLG